MASKYRKGEAFTDIHDLVTAILTDQPIYWNHKVQTSGWMFGQRLTTLQFGLMRGEFSRAHRINEEK